MDFDVTFLMQFGILLVLMLVLERLLHRPLLDVLAARERATTGLLGEARALDKLSAADKTQLEARIQQARQLAHTEREQLRVQGREQARRIEAAARQHMLNARLRARAEADALEARTAESLATTQARWSRHLVDLALGRSQQAS